MMTNRGWGRAAGLLVMVTVMLLLTPRPALAYLGPGSGLMAIGVFLAVIVAIGVAIAGFLWYPLKRVLRKARRGTPGEGTGTGDR